MLAGMAAEPFSDQERAELDRLHEFAKTGAYYQLLGIGPEASADDITSAYYTLSRDWHPDRHYRRDLGDCKPKLELVFIHINKA